MSPESIKADDSGACAHMSALPDAERLTADEGVTVGGLGVGLCASEEEGVNHVRSATGEEGGTMATKMRRCGLGVRTELTFQRCFCRRTARCSLWRGRGREDEACEKEVAGSEWHERASYDELMEDAPREVVASVERACLSMDASRDGTRREDIPSEMMLDASSWRAAR